MVNKRSLVFFLIIFINFQSWTKADDIRDFEIEGISIGDSLLNLIDNRLINNLKKWHSYPNKEYFIFVLTSKNIEINTYNYIQVDIKSNDPKYIIVALSGFLEFDNRIDLCNKKRDKINYEINQSFPGLKNDNYKKKHRSDKTGKSVNYISEFIFDTGDNIVTICEDWSSIMQSKGFRDVLRVAIVPKSYYDWIQNEAYKE